MRNRLIIDGNAVYEVDDECMKKKQVNYGVRGTGTMSSLAGPSQGKKKPAGK